MELASRQKEEKKQVASQVCMCPHCADSKFPCVNMEQTMKRAGKKEAVENKRDRT